MYTTPPERNSAMASHNVTHFMGISTKLKDTSTVEAAVGSVESEMVLVARNGRSAEIGWLRV